jgi:hypothetical protein
MSVPIGNPYVPSRETAATACNAVQAYKMQSATPVKINTLLEYTFSARRLLTSYSSYVTDSDAMLPHVQFCCSKANHTAQVSHPCHLSVCHPAVVKVGTICLLINKFFCYMFRLLYHSHQLAKQLSVRENPYTGLFQC